MSLVPNPLLRSVITAIAAGMCCAGALAQADGETPTEGTSALSDLVRQVAGAAATTSDEQSAAPDAEALSPSEPPTARVQVNDAGLLDLHLRNAQITAVLELLSYQLQTSIISYPSVEGSITANLYNVTLSQALDALLAKNGYAYKVEDGIYYVGTVEEVAPREGPPITRVFQLSYLTVTDAEKAVQSLVGDYGEVVVSEAGEGSGSGGSGLSGDSTETKSALGDFMVVTTSPERMERVAALLSDLDRRPRQVLIEATILRATLSETNELGIDFAVLGGVDFQSVNATSNASADLTLGQLPADELQNTTLNVNTDFAADVSNGGFSFGIISNNIAAFIRALESVTDVTVVANPKISALNKQPGEVIVGRRDGYLTTTVTETAAVQTVEFLETGTQIRFRPIITDDDTVRLLVHPKDSNGGLNASNLPFEETTEATADIIVRDGHTVLIGGLFRERTVSSESRIPGIGSIPGLGLLFRSQSDETTREEVIILLTVRILKDTHGEQAEFRRLLEDVERIRVGSRRGLLGIGRERLAQAFYHEAIEQAQEGDYDAALLNVRMALHNQPRHLAALKLREQLRSRTWDADGGRMRAFLLEIVESPTPSLSDDRQPPFDRPSPIFPELERQRGTPAETAE